ncbi:hypothetical protein MEO93_26505 [Dolichospermum sp. ST_sed3]|nr:hypothetical protein [Dolichospermum sp. ST_sed3]
MNEKREEFNNALIYSFEAESSDNSLKGSEDFEDTVAHVVGQYKDIASACEYAQNVILPTIRESGLSEINLSKWILEIHARIGNTLLVSCHNRRVRPYYVAWTNPSRARREAVPLKKFKIPIDTSFSQN